MQTVVTPSTPWWVRLVRILLALSLGVAGATPAVWFAFYDLPLTTFNLAWGCLVELVCLAGLLVIYLDQRR